MTIYRINPTYGSGGDGSFATPYDSYADLGSLSAGDFVLQAEGTTFVGSYTIGQSGSAGLPITFGSYDATTGDMIDFSVAANEGRQASINANGAAANCLLADTKDYITISGLRVLGSTSNSIRLQGSSGAQGCSNCIVEYCTNGDGALACISFNNAVKCTARYNKITSRATGLWAIAFSTGGAFTGCHGNLCHDNTLSTRFGTDLGAACVIASASGDSAPIGVDIVDNVCVSYGRCAIRITGWRSGCRISGNLCNNTAAVLIQDEAHGIHAAGFSATGKFSNGLIENNVSTGNGEFGIYVTFTDGCTIANNVCTYNGDKTSRHYGRGIELWAETAGDVAGVVVIGNECAYNKNSALAGTPYSEGVGIGLDDSIRSCAAVANYVHHNEGQGIQVNITSATYANSVVGNLLVENGTAGGTTINRANGAIATNSGLILWANNTHVGSTYGLWEMSTAGANNIVRNNIFYGASVLGLALDGGTEDHNAFYANGANAGTPTNDTTQAFNALSLAGSDITTDPLVDGSYRPFAASPCVGAGVYIVNARHFGGKTMNEAAPDIGAHRYYALRGAAGRRIALNRAR